MFRYLFDKEKRTKKDSYVIREKNVKITRAYLGEKVYSNLGIGFIVVALIIFVFHEIFNYKEMLFTITIVAFGISISDLIRNFADLGHLKNKLTNVWHFCFIKLADKVFGIGIILIIVLPIILGVENIDKYININIGMDVLSLGTFGVMFINIQLGIETNKLTLEIERIRERDKKLREMSKKFEDKIKESPVLNKRIIKLKEARGKDLKKLRKLRQVNVVKMKNIKIK